MKRSNHIFLAAQRLHRVQMKYVSIGIVEYIDMVVAETFDM